MNSVFTSSEWMSSRAIAFASGMSVPTSMPSQRSAHFAEGVRLGSTTMSFARVRAPEQDQVRVSDLLVGARTAACTEHRRQTDDAGRVSGSVTAIDVVGAQDDAGELLRGVVELVRGLRAAEDARHGPLLR